MPSAPATTPQLETLNMDALRSLYEPWAIPDKHRKPNPAGGAAIIEAGRRASNCWLVPRLRDEVDQWRHAGYAGASDTSLTLLLHWFHTAHDDGFRYHWCQREAMETLVYVYEVQRYRNLSSLYSSLWGEEADEAMLKSITPEDDAWSRGCCKIATGGGKTKVMSLAIVWSYFHRLREAESDLAQHFVVVAPNLIVFERLKDDFGNRKIFYADPLLPPEWKDDFDVQVILQDEAGGGASRGALYLTNIHRLYEKDKSTVENGGTSILGPTVKTAKALKTGAALRARIFEHPNLMVFNDEAHHLHDPDSAWNEALAALDKGSRAAGNAGICAQWDFTATPRNPDNTLFRHILCDFPLGEAVDAGIVKVPVIGRSDALRPLDLDDAAQKYKVHLQLGYKQYEYSYEEWSGKPKPILFVMTESTTAADEITAALDSDEFPLLKGCVINLHTKLKGKVKKGKNGAPDQFEVNEKQMSDDDLKAVREISRRLDEDDSPYRCVVSVLMLREGWDVRNVTTIVPLRAFSSGGGILAEQTLGRGLRRMTPPGGAPERVTVIEHSQFVKLYEQELALEGVVVATSDVNKKPKPPTVSIFIDKTKPIEELDIAWPQISDSVQSIPTLNNLTWEDVDARFRASYQPLPIGKPGKASIEFEMRSLFTDELVASWKIDRGLLSLGYTAVSVFVKELEKACKLQSAFATLGPVMQKFIEQTLFEKPVSLYDGSVDHRMNHSDVAEHIRATFAPLILERTVLEIKRERRETLVSLCEWKPFQAAQTPQKPVVVAKKTPFNLVPCDRDLEKNFALFCDEAEDVEAFAKNAGPQKLLIDYKTPSGRKADYIPDFFVRCADGVHYLVETKGVQDVLVPFKARAAVHWCKTASTKTRKWQYVYLPMPIFEENLDESMEILARACAPSLKNLLSKLETEQLDLPLDSTPEEVKQERTEKVLEEAGIANVPESLRQFVEQAVNQLAYDRRKNYPQFGSAFSPLLYPFEELAGELLHKYLAARVPASGSERAYYFVPDLSDLDYKLEKRFERVGKDLRQNLVYGTNSNRIGTALFCLRHAANGEPEVGGVWQDVREKLASQEMKTLSAKLDAMYDFRNRFVAHGDELLTDGDKADEEMKTWIAGLMELHAVAAGATTN